MAYIGNIFIAGNEHLGGIYKCGISYSLSMQSPISYVYKASGGDWQVEFSKNSTDVIARTMLTVSYEELQISGFSAIQEALDILSVKGLLTANLSDPAGSNVGVYHSNGKYILYAYYLFDFPIRANFNFKLIEASGNEDKSLLIELVWNESFRYYRLSQTSNDLFEAYRNLYLGLEALLNSYFPKKKNEQEKNWLERCLREVNAKTSLADFTPTGKEDPVDYIIKSQYKDIRCKLQHAKLPIAILPHSQLNPSDVKQAYSDLNRIWRHIAKTYCNVKTGGGFTTHEGFEYMMDAVFKNGATCFYTADNSRPHDADTDVSPGEHPVYKFVTTDFVGFVKPGLARIVASESVSNLTDAYKLHIHRICTKVNSKLLGIAYIESGLIVSGVDSWEYIHDIRLINASQPKTEFTT